MIFSLDSGSQHFGFCIAQRTGVRVRYVAGGKAPTTREAFLALLDRIPVTDLEAIYMETPEGHAFQPYRVPPLLKAAEFVGGVLWTCQGLGIDVRKRTAAWWRKALVGKVRSPKGQAGLIDELVRHQVRSMVIGFPDKSNVDGRDAAGLACIGAWELENEARRRKTA
jgi:Holliday junction resolvasome RuvABC endonuclease subunit